MAAYLLSPRTRRSLVQIGQYTLDNHGQRQKRQYLTMLRERMRTAARNPGQGKKRSDIKEGYYSIRAEKHNTYYRVQATHIEIIDVLHQSMEPRFPI